MKLPERSRSHVLETESEKLFLKQLPDEWAFDKKNHDYGIDYEIELFKDKRPTGKKIHLQLKSHESYDIIGYFAQTDHLFSLEVDHPKQTTI